MSRTIIEQFPNPQKSRTNITNIQDIPGPFERKNVDTVFEVLSKEQNTISSIHMLVDIVQHILSHFFHPASVISCIHKSVDNIYTVNARTPERIERSREDWSIDRNNSIGFFSLQSEQILLFPIINKKTNVGILLVSSGFIERFVSIPLSDQKRALEKMWDYHIPLKDLHDIDNLDILHKEYRLYNESPIHSALLIPINSRACMLIGSNMGGAFAKNQTYALRESELHYMIALQQIMKDVEARIYAYDIERKNVYP